MIRVVVFNGGLGNQMFQYAFYLQLKQLYPRSLFAFDLKQAQRCHYGYELDKVFNITSSSQIEEYQKLKKHSLRCLVRLHLVEQRNCLEYDSSVLKRRFFYYTRYDGYWQSEKYFLDAADAVRTSFVFNESLLNNATKDFSKLLMSGNYVSVHIRRGDYLKQPEVFGLCSDEYYLRAIEYIKEKTEYPRFVFFSDEIEWVKKKYNEEGSVYVDWNQGNESWQDMYLMTQCKHHIIANSSFSWWGAWLNPRDEKIVVAPQQWFATSPNYDVLPENWYVV